MNFQKKIDKTLHIIWENQLPQNEKSFLLDLLNGRQSTGFQYNSDSDYSLFFAYNAQKSGFQGYNDDQIDVFKNILLVNKTQKLCKIPAVSKVFKLLNENGIVPVLVKGIAFLCYYAPDIPRMMDDIDIYVQPEQFDKAISLIYDAGFSFVNDTGFHIAVTSETLDIDVHRYIYKGGGDINSDIYDRLIPCSFLGSMVYVLSPEDMLVHQLVNRAQDIAYMSHLKRHCKWIVDCHSILEFYQPNVESIIQRAKDLNSLYYAELTLSKLIELFPAKFENQELNLNDRNYCRYLKYNVQQIKIIKKIAGKNIKGLKYLFTDLAAKVKTAKIEKIVSGSTKSILHVMCRIHGINSMNDFFEVMKRFIGKSKSGTLI